MYKLSPSDFAYLWEDCKYCYYQKVKNGISYGGIFPSMFTRINKLLQDSIMGMNITDLVPSLPHGIVSVQEGFLRSGVIPGTNVYLSGRFDILTKLDDGSYGLIDFKITSPDDEKILKKYKSQLHAYKYALENPFEGEPIKITHMGAVSINPDEMKLVNGKIVFTTTPTWHPVEEDMASFLSMAKVISDFLAGPEPKVSETCPLCVYRSRFSQEKTIDDIPF